MTPMLQHALKVLQLPTLELASLVREELAENPMLEEREDAGEGTSGPKDGTEDATPPPGDGDRTTEIALDDQGLSPEGFDAESWDRYFADDEEAPVPRHETESTAEFTQTQVTRPPSLAEHLLWQLRLVTSGEEEFRIGELIIGNLDERGFLAVPLAEIAQEGGVDEERAAEVLALVQGLEPAGVGARNVTESLLLQLRARSERDPLAEVIVEKYFDLLERRQVDRIARAERTTHQAVLDAIRVISGLDPFPGRHQSTDAVEVVVPDVVLEIHDDQFVILINDEALPELRISRAYRQLLRQRQTMSPETKQYLEEKLQRAVWLIRSIEQRRKTLYRVVETIVEVQRDFFLKGVAHLRPLTLREIADRVGLHESTISRVTSKKYLQTPRGVFELRYFFSSQVKTTDGGHTSSTSVKAALEELIAQEDADHPWSDQKLTELLAQRGIEVARRTVAKYREELNLLPASRRRRLS